MKSVILFLIVVGVLSQNPPAPVWPTRWQAKFSEIIIDNTTYLVNGTTTGVYSYDASKNVSRVDRLDGSIDGLCGTTITGRTPCSDIVSGGKRYLYFAEKNFCCLCCLESQGCGILKPSWPSDSTYTGTVTGPNGETLNQWTNYDDSVTYYVERADHAPFEIYRTGIPELYSFDLTTYTTKFSETIFTLPKGCSTAQQCPSPSLCSIFQESRVKLNQY